MSCYRSSVSSKTIINESNGAMLDTVDPPSVLKHTIRILIADDHPAIRETVKGILKAHPGFEVVGEAIDGQQAVSLAESLKPDVIVINVTMPKMSGFEAARGTRTHFPNCPFVISRTIRIGNLLRKRGRLEPTVTSRSQMPTGN